MSSDHVPRPRPSGDNRPKPGLPARTDEAAATHGGSTAVNTGHERPSSGRDVDGNWTPRGGQRPPTLRTVVPDSTSNGAGGSAGSPRRAFAPSQRRQKRQPSSHNAAGDSGQGGKPAVEKQPVQTAPAATGSEATEPNRTDKDAELERMREQVLVLEAQLTAAQRATPATPAGGCVVAGPEQPLARRVPIACSGLSPVSSQPSLAWSPSHGDAETGIAVAQQQSQSCEGLGTGDTSNGSVIVLTSQPVSTAAAVANCCASVPAPRSTPLVTQISTPGSGTATPLGPAGQVARINSAHVLGIPSAEATSHGGILPDQTAWLCVAGQWRPAQAFGAVSGAGPPQVVQTVRPVLSELGTRATVPAAQPNLSMAPGGWHSPRGHSEGRSMSPSMQAMPPPPAQPTPRTRLVRSSSSTSTPPGSGRNTVPSQVGQHVIPSVTSWSAMRGARQ